MNKGEPFRANLLHRNNANKIGGSREIHPQTLQENE